jgi:hypothetical protein
MVRIIPSQDKEKKEVTPKETENKKEKIQRKNLFVFISSIHVHQNASMVPSSLTLAYIGFLRLRKKGLFSLQGREIAHHAHQQGE